jgi:hypothetical protein
MAHVRLSDTASIASDQTRALREIHDVGGDAAFDRAARVLLFNAAALIAIVRGRERLAEIMAAADTAIVREGARQ